MTADRQTGPAATLPAQRANRTIGLPRVPRRDLYYHPASAGTFLMSDSTWFVSYRPLGLSRDPRRLSETFPNELEAKAFAKARLADARNITAGTINPHLPKRVIGSAQIIEWLNEAR